MASEAHLSTGLPGLDRMIKGVHAGDNIVFAIDSIDQYRFFVPHYVSAALKRGQQVTYFRFSRHEPLVDATDGVEVCVLDPEQGFELFITRIHEVVQRHGRGNYYVFDCLSDLSDAWFSDLMLANMFMLICPYLYDVEAIACFALMRGQHATQTTQQILHTTQVWIDVYDWQSGLFIQPLKVQRRYSSTMFMLHEWTAGTFRPVTESAIIADVLNSVTHPHIHAHASRLGLWNHTLLQAEEAFRQTELDQCELGAAKDLYDRLLRMMVTREPRMMELASRYLTLGDMIRVGERVIGSSQIGGKAVGMLLARAILQRQNARWKDLLETHDSFYIGSDVFYTFLVTNGIWWLRERQRDPHGFLEGSERARQRILVGEFPDYVREQFAAMLDYFGQSPIIVRSSSLLEDNYGNAFAGKYESVFCVNQGPRDKRLEDFLSAVRMIYASAMSEKALHYRAQRGLLERDEQMGLLVQRVSGTLYKQLFFPHIGGVALSFNPYVWSPAIDPAAGMVRMAFGLGTHAVDRSDDDYTRIIALNAPMRRPEANFSQVRQFAQRRVDALDLEADQLVSIDFEDVAKVTPEEVLDWVAPVDETLPAGTPATTFARVLTFERLIAKTKFVADLREMLATLQQAYDYPVDVEFTVNFTRAGAYKINIVQCRPLQVQGSATGADCLANPRKPGPESIVMEVHGAVIGPSREIPIHWIIYVNPDAYSVLPIAQRYAIARLIGRITHLPAAAGLSMLLMGPGRWGTSSPSLGVPVNLVEISPIAVLCELVEMGETIIPDVSLGTHFFNDLVELDMLYLALFPRKKGNCLNQERLLATHNSLEDLLPEDRQWAEVVRVIEARELGGGLCLHANNQAQHALLFSHEATPAPGTCS